MPENPRKENKHIFGHSFLKQLHLLPYCRFRKPIHPNSDKSILLHLHSLSILPTISHLFCSFTYWHLSHHHNQGTWSHRLWQLNSNMHCVNTDLPSAKMHQTKKILTWWRNNCFMFQKQITLHSMVFSIQENLRICNFQCLSNDEWNFMAEG